MCRVELEQLREDLEDIGRELRDLLAEHRVERRKESDLELANNRARWIALAHVRDERRNCFKEVVVEGCRFLNVNI